ncbi:hypothetical protein [Ensifer sp. ZNC0028]|uniref:hypothetical protein n=1 Tax=Ensifer sp. ZNC0028 TaxID=1339236 RepID=UPI0012DFF030|nr:hypothetical protein [Ensifer sp. ZNC0028]
MQINGNAAPQSKEGTLPSCRKTARLKSYKNIMQLRDPPGATTTDHQFDWRSLSASQSPTSHRSEMPSHDNTMDKRAEKMHMGIQYAFILRCHDYRQVA